MILPITKMHGIGNSYVIIDDMDRKLEPMYPDIAKAISDKSFGVGSDGILVLNKGMRVRFCMRIFNPDGSEAEMCGNGIRMFALYLFDRKLIGREAEIEVGKGKIVRSRINSDKTITVDMGKGELLQRIAISVDGKTFTGLHVSVGNPHFVVFTGSEEEALKNVRNYGSIIERHKMFPNRTNVEFAYVKNKSSISIRVWERGAGPTLACGSGASATAFAAFKEKKTDNRVNVALPGGALTIEVADDDSILMTGPAEYIFSGTIDVDKMLERNRGG